MQLGEQKQRWKVSRHSRPIVIGLAFAIADAANTANATGGVIADKDSVVENI